MQTTGFRACETCRTLKVRCMSADGDATSGSASGGSSTLGGGSSSSSSAAAVVLPPVSERAPCRRCQDTGTTCVYTEPRRTKRKRTDVRVRELEREVRMLTELLVLRRRMAEEGGIQVAEYEGTAAAGSTARASLAASELHPLPDTPSALFIDSQTTGAPYAGQAQHRPPSASSHRVRFPPVYDANAFPPPPPPIDLTLHGPPRPDTVDPVAAGLLTMGKATRLFRRYVTMIAPQRPFVVFPSVTLSGLNIMTAAVERAIADTAALVREHKPVLFLSLLTAAVGSGLDSGDSKGNGKGDSDNDNDALSTALDALLLRVYADRIFYQSEKSLELVQALLISSNWNFYSFDKPSSSASTSARESASHSRDLPGHSLRDTPTASAVSSLDHLRFYQHMHMAATMAIELESMHRSGVLDGFGISGIAGITGTASAVDGLLADPLAFERTLLACYICCSSISLGFHRQAMLSFTPAMAGYLRRLETSPHAAATDPVMVAWVHLQRTVDMTADALRMRATATRADTMSNHDSYEGVPDLSDPSVQTTLDNVTRRLEQWRQDHSRYMTSKSYFSLYIYIYIYFFLLIISFFISFLSLFISPCQSLEIC